MHIFSVSFPGKNNTKVLHNLMISVEEEISRLRELGTRREKDSFKSGNMKVITINFAFDLCKSSLN